MSEPSAAPVPGFRGQGRGLGIGFALGIIDREAVGGLILPACLLYKSGQPVSKGLSGRRGLGYYAQPFALGG